MRTSIVSLLLLASCNTAPEPKGESSDSGTTTTDEGGGSGADGGATGGGGSDGGTDDGGAALTETWTFDEDTVTVSVTEAEGLRTYTLTSTHTQRDSGPSERTITEQETDPRLRSGVLLTDALFAMAVDDAHLNEVDQVSDGAFAEPVSCRCYKTGEQWNWVWTRDIAYATELGLAWLDPARAAESLLFKLSEEKNGGNLQIVQDTGTGGSWPVSTDRVTWARGAMAVLRYMDHAALRAAAIEAMHNTATLDRAYAYDASDGLYRGETSFLDWREQSYAAWTATDVAHIAMSKSLSTNLNHLFLLRSLEELTGEDHNADALAEAIDRTFWDGAHYRSYTSTTLDPAPVARQDLLATSLAVLDLGTHPEALSRYPWGPYGPPVIWPQQQETPIYHNRAIWPFVTAYAVLAGREANNGQVVASGLDSLVRGAALNLSHMENMEFASGDNWVEDGVYSGPVVNSRRQLWSVAGFLGAIAHGVFGLDGRDGVLIADPVLPHSRWILPGATLTLGTFTATLDGRPFDEGARTLADLSDWTQIYGARTPSVSLSGAGNSVSLDFSSDEDSTFDVYRNGSLVESNARAPWSDIAETTACYAVVASMTWASQPSAPICWWGDEGARVQQVFAADFTAEGGTWATDHGREHYGNWGAPDHTLSVALVPRFTGDHLLQAVFGNGAGPVSSGITAAVKWLTVHHPDGALVGEGPLVMPHRTSWDDWGDSTFVPVTLEAGLAYRVTIQDGFNMSHLAHYRDYVAGRGGGDQPSNDVNISELRLLFLD